MGSISLLAVVASDQREQKLFIFSVAFIADKGHLTENEYSIILEKVIIFLFLTKLFHLIEAHKNKFIIQWLLLL